MERKRLFKMVAFFLVIFTMALFFYVQKDLLVALIQQDTVEIEQFLDRYFLQTIGLLFVIMLIQHSITIFPLLLIITINVSLFGLWEGFLWSWLFSLVASMLVFYITRYFLQQWIASKVPDMWQKKIEQNGFLYVLQARVFPFIPTSLVNWVAGISTIRLTPFIIATAIGNGLFFFILALIPAGVLSADRDTLWIWGVAVVVFVMLYGMQRRRALK